MKRARRPKGHLLVFAAALPLATVAVADGFKFGVDAGVGETDNVTLVETHKESQTLAIADLDFSLKGKSSHLDEDVVGDFSYIDFLQNAYGHQLLGRLNGSLRYALVPESLTWTLQDNWGQAQLTPFGPLVPTNQQNVNYLSTGPDWYARLGSTTFLDVGARYARADYSSTPINSNRLLGSVQLGREMSALSSMSLNASVERVMYENTVLNTNYDLANFFARYELHGARTDLALNLGADRATQGGQSSSGASALLVLTRKLSAAASLSVSAGHDLTDSGAGFNVAQTTNAINAVNVNSVVNNSSAPLTSSLYTSNYVAAGWNYERNRTTLGLSARWEKDTYVDQPQFDGSRNRFDANLEHRLTRALSAQIHGSLVQSRFDREQFIAGNGGYSERDGLYGFSLILREGRGLEIRLRGDHLSRSVTAGAGTGYAENRAFLTVGYRPQ